MVGMPRVESAILANRLPDEMWNSGPAATRLGRRACRPLQARLRYYVHSGCEAT